VSEKSTRNDLDYADESRAAPNRSVFRPEYQLCRCHTAEERYNPSESRLKKEIPDKMAAMKSVIAWAVVVMLFVVTAAAETGDGTQWSFQHYPAAADFTGTPAKPILLTPHERLFRTQILTQARSGPNFAGHFTIAKWGCGSPCIGFAIINERTGAVYDAVDPVLTVACVDNNRVDSSLDFNIKSRLVVATGFSDKLGCGDNYFEWDGKRLKLIHFKPWPNPGGDTAH